MSVTKVAMSGALLALTLCTSIDLLDMIWYSNAANKPMKSIQLAIENVPPSSVFLFLTTF